MTFDGDNNKEEETLAIAATAIANSRLAKLSIVILLATIAGFIISEFIQFVFHITTLSLSVIAMHMHYICGILMSIINKSYEPA